MMWFTHFESFFAITLTPAEQRAAYDLYSIVGGKGWEEVADFALSWAGHATVPVAGRMMAP
jgi:hypothetical protein